MRLIRLWDLPQPKKEAPAQGSAGALLLVNCWLRGQRHDGSITRQLPCDDGHVPQQKGAGRTDAVIAKSRARS